MRVSEKVTNYKDWQQGDIITITAGTGVGKSHFVKNSLYIHAKENNKKILFLVHRLNCLNQFKYELERENKTDVITLATYQSIQQSALRGEKSNFNHPADFDYVICDEFHYFMSDASFNVTTDLSLDTILEATDSIRVFMSATGDYVERYLANYRKKEIRSYAIPIKFDFIKALTFFNKDETMEYYVDLAIKNNKKAIFFIDSAKKAYDLHKKYEKYSMFNCSASNNLFKHVDEKKLKSMLEDERFEDLILFTTTAMDTGVNINDTEINHILCDVRDIRTLTQCIGRKRLQVKGDYIHLVVKNRHNQQLGGDLTDLNAQMKMANYLNENSTRDLIKQFPRQYDKSRIIYDKWENGELVKEINELAYFKCRTDQVDVNSMLELGNYGYSKYVAQWFGKYDEENNKYDYQIEEELSSKKSLEEYLDSIVGKRLIEKVEKGELIEQINLKDSRGRIQKGLKTINSYFQENDMSYKIVNKRTSVTVDNAKKRYTYWEILGNVIH